MIENQKKTVNILGLAFIKTTFSKFILELENRINHRQNTFVITANPEIVMYAKQHLEYQNLIKKADYLTPDGIGIIKAGQILKNPLPETITGYDLFVALLKWGNKNHKSVYFLGAHQKVIDDLLKTVHHCYPHIRVSGAHNGYFSDPQPIIQKIKKTQPDLIFCALGYPKQERFIQQYRHLSNGLWMGIGGSFDVLSGHTQRAPQFWIKHHLEWLYRLIKEPWRFKRMLALPKFVLAVYQQRANQHK